jgi:NTP pyrophosphatase (non-canonical NTP hydrolase)
LGVAEECGELAHAILKRKQGIRGDSAYHVGQAADAVGDIIIYLTGVCSSLGLDLETCVENAWKEVRERDWSEHKETGVETN